MDKNFLVVLLLVPALAVSYYFGVALPAHNRALLEFQKQKYEDQKEAKIKAEHVKENNARVLEACHIDADTNYWAYIKLNKLSSRIDAEGSTVYTAPTHIWASAERNKKDYIADCMKRYGE